MMVETRCGLLCSWCSYREAMNCPGCVDAPQPFHGQCRVKNCCEGRGAIHCGECQEFPCALLREFSYDSEHGDDGARIEQCRHWAVESETRRLAARAESIMKAASTATIAVIDDRGFPRASTISSIRTDGVRHAWFSTGLQSGKVRCLENNNRASLCYRDGGHNVTLIGTIEILTDQPIKRELWQDWFIDHFPAGQDDPNYCILRFTAEQASLWVDSIGREIGIDELADHLK